LKKKKKKKIVLPFSHTATKNRKKTQNTLLKKKKKKKGDCIAVQPLDHKVGPGDHVAQLGFLFPPMGPWSLCCSVVGWL
jgi:hypothetical protein